MESLVPTEDQLPWKGKGGLAIYQQCAEYIAGQFGIGKVDVMFSMSQREWHELLYHAYRELVALGEITPPSTEHV